MRVPEGDPEYIAMVFTKRLGTGVIATALKRGIASEEHAAESIRSMLTLNADHPRAPEAALALLPFGTGGDFRRTIGVPRDTRAAARLVAERHIRTIDVGHLQLTARDGAPIGRIFINIASFGVSGLVDEYVNRTS